VADVPLTLVNESNVEGLVLVFEWDVRKLDGVDLVPATAAGQALEGADIVQTRVEDNFMILSALIDLDLQGPAFIPPGERTIGTARLRCICRTEADLNVPLTPIDGRYALVGTMPLLDNIIVVGGRSIGQANGLGLENGLVTCRGEGGVPEGPAVTCGGAIAPDGSIPSAEGQAGGTAAVSFFYRFPPNGRGDRSDEIQGFSLSVRYDCRLSCIDSSARLDGSALEQAGTEFFLASCDNNPGDGDGCELVVGALLDVEPPFRDQTLPPTAAFRLLFTLDFRIAQDVPVGTCLPVEFVDGLNGPPGPNGQPLPPTPNVVSVNNLDHPWQTAACEVCVTAGGGGREFIRGDCNSNGRVNVADAAAMVAFLFLAEPRRFDPPCLDACDSNDDGANNIVDVMYLLVHLFRPGSPPPPAPGPVRAGPDPTADGLSCLGP
jgi:hypothetical protein